MLIRRFAPNFRVIAAESSSVTAEASGSSPVVPASFFNQLINWHLLNLGASSAPNTAQIFIDFPLGVRLHAATSFFLWPALGW